MASVKRDERFYLAKGDCVFRIQDTLFKVHQFLFAQDDSTFVDLFSLPQEELSKMEGSSDDNPILLQGDTVEEFRALCWALYMPLLEARKQDTIEADMPQLLHLAFITNKYKFTTTEKWVTDILLHHCRSTPGRLNFAQTCTPGRMERLFDIAVRCDQHELREEVEAKCLERFKAGEFTAAFVLDLGERLQLRSFLGNAYYAHLMKLCSVSKRPPEETAPLIPAGRAVARIMSTDTADLAPIHSQRLYAGFISLSYCWDSFTVIQVPSEGKKRPSGGCSMHDSWSCSTEDCWRTLFGQAALAKPLPDVLARLGLIGHKSRKTKTPCVVSIPDIADGLYWRVSDELPDHFNVTYGEGTVDASEASTSTSGSSEST